MSTTVVGLTKIRLNFDPNTSINASIRTVNFVVLGRIPTKFMANAVHRRMLDEISMMPLAEIQFIAEYFPVL